VLITGGAGFMGSNLVSHLCRKYPDYRVLVLDILTYAGNLSSIPEAIRNDGRFAFWYGNIKNSQLVDDLVARADAVVHMAAESHVARSIYDNALCFDTNVMGTQVVANSVLRHRKKVERFVLVSTSEVYGTAVAAPMSEDHPLNALTPYASAKAGADRLVYSYWATYDIPALIIRPFNNYGPRQHLEKVIPRFVTSALLGEPITVHGDGSYTRDWVYVEDFCEAIDRALHVPFDPLRGQVVNVGTGKEVSIRLIAETVLRLLPDTRSEIRHIENRPGQVRRHISSTERAARLLDWKARTGFEEGLARTVQWYADHRSWWEPLLWMRRIPIMGADGRMEMY
jgi:dTDP-glucose 4,6-dehydratase